MQQESIHVARKLRCSVTTLASTDLRRIRLMVAAGPVLVRQGAHAPIHLDSETAGMSIAKLTFQTRPLWLTFVLHCVQ